MQKHICLNPVLLAILAATSSVYAQDKATQLEEVVVSGSKEGTAIKKTPVAINKINKAVLEEKKPTFVGQVLNQTPGVYVTDLGNGQHMTSIRYPITTSAVYQYLEDGIPIRPVGLFNHNAMYEINLDGIESIEVIKGPASSLYGSNAAGGAVNFLTKAAGPKPEAMIGYQRSNQGYQKYDFGVSGSSEKQGLRITGFVSDRTGGWQTYNNADRAGVTARHDLALGERTTLKTIATYNRLFTQMPGSLNRADYDNRAGYSYQTFTWRKVEATRLSTALEGNWNEGGLTTLTAYYRNNTTNQLPSFLIFGTGAIPPGGTYQATAAGRTTDNSFESRGFDARHRQDFLQTRLRLIVGASLEETPMEANEKNLAITRNPFSGIYTGYTVGTTRRDYTVDVSSKALYSQLEYTPLRAVTLVAGGRYDKITYDYKNKLVPSATTGAASEERSYNQFSPKLGATWNPTNQVNLYTNVSRGFAPPEVSSQYGGSLAVPNLKPAVYDNLDLGVRFTSADKKYNSEIALYRLIGRDEQVSYTISPGLSEPRNAGKTLHQGIEFGFGYREKVWDARLNGTYAQHKFQEYRTSATLDYSGKDMQKAPKWLVNGEVGVKPTNNLRLSSEVQYLSSYYMDLANTVKYNGHTLLNLRASYKWQGAELWAGLFNATNKKYADDASSSYSGVGAYNPNAQDTFSPGAPRTFLVGIRYTLGAK
ncbi:TonB-dependent receptor family protein [Parvibium lacunae]|uniref:TonB-dependent receptor n=1 Tax=Parvibium lacunae TaxID=1888893 RepID=A0A368L6Z3_9BURK|nr:TonB-dependent receptor [Parvibium lacunae]RCS59435.1 TonB-dependent receptor [Parvibium lacunae]